MKPNSKGWQLSQHSFDVNKSLLDKSKSMVSPLLLFTQCLHVGLKEKISLLCLNKEMVTKLPQQANFEILGSNDLCPVQGLLNDHILTFQGNAESNNFII